MKHSDEFVEGMTNIKELQDDLSQIKSTSSTSKKSIAYLKHKIVLN